MTRKEIFANMFNELNVSDKVDCFNTFAEYYHCAKIWELNEYEINEMCRGMEPWDIINKYGDIDTNADYFVEDVYLTTYTDSEIEDYIADYIDQIYNTDRFDDWVDEDELDEACTDYFTGIIEREFGEQDEDTLLGFFDGYYNNEAEDEENLDKFREYLEELKKEEE